MGSWLKRPVTGVRSIASGEDVAAGETAARSVDATSCQTSPALLQSPFAGGVEHEINNLLSRMICLAEEIQDESDMQAIHEYAETLIITAESAADVLRRHAARRGAPAADMGPAFED